MLNINGINIIELNFNTIKHCLTRTKQDIKGIVIHDTESANNQIPNIGVQNLIYGWASSETAVHVNTPFIISRDGTLYHLYNSYEFYGYHLGIPGNNAKYDKSTIGIELMSCGPLTTEYPDKFKNQYDQDVNASEVITFTKPFRGFNYYHGFTDKQLNTLKLLLQYLCNDLNIPKTIDTETFWDYNQSIAKNNTQCISTHTTHRKDKADTQPQPNLINTLKKL